MTANLLPVNSILNPRDLGGIVGLDGRKIKTHRTFRSNMRILSSASDSFFDTVLLTIEEQYQNMDAYLKNVLDVTPELRDRLRKLYLDL